ncbi:histidine phosphatase family protein [Chloroflexota bacterium]
MPRLLLVRHGSTEFNDALRFAGVSDIELNTEGIRQAEKLRDRLAKEKIDVIYCSELKRALATARIISPNHQTETVVCPELRECNYGEAEGLTIEEIRQRFPEIASAMSENSLEIDFPGGESFNSFIHRAGTFANRLDEHTAEQTILVVTHGGVLRALVCCLLGLDKRHWWNFQFSNASLSVIEMHRRRRRLTLLNDTSHLNKKP